MSMQVYLYNMIFQRVSASTASVLISFHYRTYKQPSQAYIDDYGHIQLNDQYIFLQLVSIFFSGNNSEWSMFYTSIMSLGDQL
jgi:hypothetical protein